MFGLRPQIEVPISAGITALGVLMTSVSVLVHAALFVAPGALLTTIGSAWLGNALARQGVRFSTRDFSRSPEVTS